LLNAFAGNIAGDGRVFILSPDLVDLIYINDAGLSPLDVATGVLDQSKDNVFNIFADISGLGKGCSINDGEWNAQEAGQGLGQKRLSGSRRADQQNIGLLKLDIGFLPGELDALVMIVNGDCQFFLDLSCPMTY
jgi:hypothetical protein